jgi:LysM repeat protein
VLCLLWLWAALVGPAPRLLAQTPPTHTIERGETLSQIAQQYGIDLAELMALNGITDGDAIYFGQQLLLPQPETLQAETPEPETPEPETLDAEVPEPDTTPDAPTVAVDTALTPDADPSEHLVQPGESLSRIAEQYGITQAELLAINGISDPDTIVIGQRLRLTPVLTTERAQADTPPAAVVPNRNPIATLNRTYTIAPGDAIATIALRFGVDETALRALNRVETDRLLEVGQVLILPATPQETAITARVVDAPATDALPRYAVLPGDSLGQIAQANGVSLAALLEANGITNPDTVFIGQELTIPQATPPVIEAESAPVARIPHQIGKPRNGFYYYTVKVGDTLSTLARDFDTTQLALLEYNDLPNSDTVYFGLELQIPYGPPPLALDLPPVPLSGTRFMVSLSRQQCWLLAGDEVRYAWTCSTGYGKWITRTGNFAVQSKIEMAKSSAYALDMPYWLGIYDVGTFENGIHGLPIKWETGEKIWEGLIGQPATFGCAMLGDEDAATLFDLAYLGMPVHIVP